MLPRDISRFIISTNFFPHPRGKERIVRNTQPRAAGVAKPLMCPVIVSVSSLKHYELAFGVQALDVPDPGIHFELQSL